MRIKLFEEFNLTNIYEPKKELPEDVFMRVDDKHQLLALIEYFEERGFKDGKVHEEARVRSWLSRDDWEGKNLATFQSSDGGKLIHNSVAGKLMFVFLEEEWEARDVPGLGITYYKFDDYFKPKHQHRGRVGGKKYGM